MIIVAVETVVQEGGIDELRDALHTMEKETRKEPGCLTYAFSVDITEPTLLRVFERWESMEALESHFKSPHMAVFREAIGQTQPKSRNLKIYEVDKELEPPQG